MPYATPQDMLDQIDNRWLCQLILDNNVPATTTQFLNSKRPAIALASAAGTINAYAFQGQRYLPSDLAGLTGDDAAMLNWVNVNIGAGRLAAMSRQVPSEDVGATLPMYAEAQAFLQQLQLGNVIFNVAANQNAGLPHTQVMLAGMHTVHRARRIFGRQGPWWCSSPGGPCWG